MSIGCLLWCPLGVYWTAVPVGCLPWLPAGTPGVLSTAVPTDDPTCLGGQCLNVTRRPTVKEFERFLPWFLHDRPTLQCAKG